MTFKNIFLTLLFVSFVASVTAQDAKWEIDKSHSSITFKVSHFKIATVKGNFGYTLICIKRRNTRVGYRNWKFDCPNITSNRTCILTSVNRTGSIPPNNHITAIGLPKTLWRIEVYLVRSRLWIFAIDFFPCNCLFFSLIEFTLSVFSIL